MTHGQIAYEAYGRSLGVPQPDWLLLPREEVVAWELAAAMNTAHHAWKAWEEASPDSGKLHFLWEAVPAAEKAAWEAAVAAYGKV